MGQSDGMAWRPLEPDEADCMPPASTGQNQGHLSCHSLTTPTETPERSKSTPCYHVWDRDGLSLKQTPPNGGNRTTINETDASSAVF